MTAQPLYEKKTQDMIIRVRPRFIEDESAPVEHRYVWAYTIQIENAGTRTVQLLTRHWKITDRAGRVQEVHGEGVVGQTPVLEPGDTFEYTSGAPLSEPSGVMEGAYGLSDGEGDFTVDIPAFSLDSPYDSARPN